MIESQPRKPEDLEGLEKILLSVETWGGDQNELLWCKKLDDSKYQLKNLPFYAYDLSYDDVVVASVIKEFLAAELVAERSGHSTYRVFATNADMFFANWERFSKLGCTFEKATERLFAIDVPPQTDVHSVYQALEEGENGGVWEFEEGHCGHFVEEP